MPRIYKLSPKRPTIQKMLAEKRSAPRVMREVGASQQLVYAVQKQMPNPEARHAAPKPQKPKEPEVAFSYGAPKFRVAINKLKQAGHSITEEPNLRLDGRPVLYGRLIELAERL